MGRHDAVQWTDDLQNSVIDSIEQGNSLRQVSEKIGISRQAVLRQCRANPSFADRYSRAMELRSELDFEGMAEIFAGEPERNKWGIDPAWVNWKRLELTTYQWMLAKRNPRKYGERIDHNVDGQISVTFSAKSILDAVPEAKQIDAGPKQIEGDTTASC
jgi:hypothetical protein